ELRCGPPVVLREERELRRIRIHVRRVLRVARERRQPEQEVGEGAAGERPVEEITAVILPREKRDLILVFHVLDVGAALERVRYLDPGEIVVQLCRAAERLARLVAAGRDERAVAELERRNAARRRRRRQTGETVAAKQIGAL